MSESKESDLKKQIFEYMMDQNRPFSANDIFSNMHLDCGKTAFTRALDLLVSDGKVKEKTYGKQKIYFINQDLFTETEEDLKNMDDQITELTNIYIKMQKEVKNYETKLADLEKKLKAEERIVAIKAEIPVLEDKLRALQEKAVPISADERNALLVSKEKVMKEYQHRKRLANNIIDAIMEGYPKDKKQLLEEIGIEETDEDSKLQT